MAKNLKKGDKVKVTGNSAGHGISIGTILTVLSVLNSIVRVKEYARNLYDNDVELLFPTKEDIEAEIINLQKELTELQTKQKFMDDNDLTEYDVDQAYQTLAIIEGADTTKIQKAKLIADLLKK